MTTRPAHQIIVLPTNYKPIDFDIPLHGAIAQILNSKS